MVKRNVFLENRPLEEAREAWFGLLEKEGVVMPVESEEVPAGDSAGRVTAEPLFARVSSPPFHSAAMDGVAVPAGKTYGASDTSPVRLEIGTDVEWIDTGESLPPEYDAVIMVEDLNEVGEGAYEIIKPVAPWQHVRPLGEDIVQSELILPAGHTVRPVDISALLNGGFTTVPVRRRPLVAIIPTGTELVEKPEDLGPGRVMESNSRALAAFAAAQGARAHRMDLIPDDRESIIGVVKEALSEADAVVINAGTSAGREDYTRSIIEELGSVAVHGVAMKPGKPVVLGVAGGKPVIGLPGFPVANYRGAEEFLAPLVRTMLGTASRSRSTLEARLARKVFSTPGFDEFVQVKVGRVHEQVVAVPLPRGSGVSMSLVRSDGSVKVPKESEGIGKWETVDVLLHGGAVNVEGTILAVGSHDVSLDLLADWVRRKDPGVSLASANVGSMGGIMAVKQGQAHLAGTHLLDPETGDFNVPYVLRSGLAGEVLLVNLAWRMQGLIVLPGNPKGIEEISDLASDGIRFVNRQKGSGTRMLLDYNLKGLDLRGDDIEGYRREVFTHTAVAAAVAGGTADAGLGVKAAAQALKLDFIPVAEERYDLLVTRSFVGSAGFRALVSSIEDPEYRQAVENLGGYDLRDAGSKIEIKTG